MTASDDRLGDLLRRALTAAVSEVEPSADGLSEIRARIGSRPPRPWLFSTLTGVAQRLRYWTWRGHWAWPRTLPVAADSPVPQVRRMPLTTTVPSSGGRSAGGDSAGVRSRPARSGAADRLGLAGGGWLRPVVALAGLAVILGISFGVQPFREGIIAASNSVLSGGSSKTGGHGTAVSATPGGNGGQTPGGPVAASSPSGTASARASASGSAAGTNSALATATPPGPCGAARLTVWRQVKPAGASATATASASATATASASATATASASATATASATAPGDVPAGPLAPTTAPQDPAPVPVPSASTYTTTPAPTPTPSCVSPTTAVTLPATAPATGSVTAPVSSPGGSPTPTGTATPSPSAPPSTPTPTTGSPTSTSTSSPTPTPTGTPTTASPTPTPTATPAPTDPGTASPTPTDPASDGAD